jgi:hypothetical protein
MSKHKFSDEDFISAIKSSFSIKETLEKLGLAPYGSSYKTFKLRVKKLNIDISHFTGQGHLKGKSCFWAKRIDLSEVLVQNSSRILKSAYKCRMIKEGLLKNECYKCGLKDTWQGELIVLHIDHINGDHFDHRIENLRLLCPNCHSQTSTYCSKNKKRRSKKDPIFKEKEKHKCKLCNKIIRCESTYCGECYKNHRKELQSNYVRKNKINWMPIEELLLRLETTSFLALAKELGVSDNAIRKHIKNHTEFTKHNGDKNECR